MSESQVVECSKIRVPSGFRKGRTFSKETAKSIAESVKVVGLLQPIGLVPVKDDPNWLFDLVFGEHRLVGVRDILKETSIAAVVFPEYDAEDQELARIAENLYRTPNAPRAQYFAAVQRWAQIYDAKYPDRVGKGKAGSAAAKAKKAKKGSEAAASGPTADSAVGAEAAPEEPRTEGEAEPAADVPGFATLLAGTTGVAQRTAEKSARIARSFTAEQLQVLDAKSVGVTDMETLAGVKDEAERARAVNLVASGMDVATAVASLTDPGAEAEREAAKSEAGMTDQEWVEHFCADLRSKLGENAAAFDASAALYRKFKEARSAAKNKMYRHLAAAAAAGPIGRFGTLVRQFLSVSHPRDWIFCSTCSGTGKIHLKVSDGQTATCTKCLGDGFKLNFEK